MANISTTETASRPSRGARSKNATASRAGPGVDLATILGVTGAFALIITAMVIGGSPGAFVDIPAILIVLGGSFLVTSISFSLDEVIRAQRVLLHAVVYRQQRPQKAALQILTVADRARSHGVLALEAILPELRFDSFLFKATSMVVDGLPGDEVERILVREVEETTLRHKRTAGILRRAGEVAPAMGLIGTLIGLVQMLGNLEDPTSIGPAMAVALLTTFYGAILANLVFLPIAKKLERNSGAEAEVKQIYAIGAASIARQENPRRLEMMLNTVLSPGERVSYFD